MKDTIVCIEQIPEYFSSDLKITITCKKSEVYEAQAIINHLSSIINITLERYIVVTHKDYSLLRDIGADDE
jgi:predicted nucleic-acid-binding Zn-ribbon protein